MCIQASKTIITFSPLCPWHFSSYTKKLTWKKGQKPRNKEKGMGEKREEKKKKQEILVEECYDIGAQNHWC